MISVSNRGGDLVATSYWTTEHARRGLLYLTCNAGVLRVLVPEPSAGLLEDLPAVGVPCQLRRSTFAGRPTYQFAWLDGEVPYIVEIDQRQCDRGLPADGLRELVWYSPGVDPDAPVVSRRELVDLGQEVLS